MAIEVTTTTITVRKGLRAGFDVILNPGHVDAIGFRTEFCNSDLPPGWRRVKIPLEAFLHTDFFRWMLEEFGGSCPDLEGWIGRLLHEVEEALGSEALVNVRFNSEVDGRCAPELCYWDRDRQVVVCLE